MVCCVLFFFFFVAPAHIEPGLPHSRPF